VEARHEAAKRRWRGALIGTAVMQLSYVPLILVWQAAIGGADLDPGLMGQALGFGLGVMPIVFITVAFVSRHLQAPRAVLKAMALCIVVGGPLFLMSPILGAAGGYVAGGTVALRVDFGPRAMQARIVAAVAVVLGVMLLVLTIPLAGAIAGGLTPFLMLAYSDHRIAKLEPVRPDEDDGLLQE
jgi:hypothetical protein